MTDQQGPPRGEAKCETAALVEAFTGFLARFAPAVGERHDGIHLADADCRHDPMIVARDDACVAAFEAIEYLARKVVDDARP